jgi:ribonuclease VapC
LNGAIVIDSSALLSLLLGEQESQAITEAILSSARRKMSTFSFLESNTVALSRKGTTGQLRLASLCGELSLEIVPFDFEQAQIACLAWSRFGKGRHPAALNVGDCCSYALARVQSLPLLCKGNDFVKTDLELVAY